MKYRWIVYIKEVDKYVKRFEFNDYDSVQNLLGYMMEGTDFISLDIKKEAIDE